MSNTRDFMLTNFSSVTKSEEFFNLSYEEVKMWISRDDIHVDCEDNVFIVIVAWIYHNKQDRRKTFPSCFVKFDFFTRHVISYKMASLHVIL